MTTASFPSIPCKVHVQHSSFHSPSVIIQTDQLNFVCSFRRDHQFSKDTKVVVDNTMIDQSYERLCITILDLTREARDHPYWKLSRTDSRVLSLLSSLGRTPPYEHLMKNQLMLDPTS